MTVMYQFGVENMMKADIDFDTVNFKIALLASAGAITVNQAHADVADISASIASTNGRSANLTSPTTNSPVPGVFDAADASPLWTGLDDANDVKAAVLFNDTPAADADKLLIAFFDDWTGFALTPNTGDVNMTFAGTTDRIFRLVA